ncbi:type I 3-dehydroquinate dehydratase [Brachybacterium squillarum]|uniref:type I 3-dehydroquinate dehydratase n=1 Tax=Brachybacterium squillarum TaxID=661979 RepID=UPI0022226D59|nr:type I 3-dehydroquinate dehydratase [Brachybacterium squillarum]MCW1803668.1 type I 3-dehydroquinate dehydratase [Brachybacterium squillarum]
MSSPTLTVRGVELGAGRPEIIVPVAGDDEAALHGHLAAARRAPARIVEWRTDRFARGAGTAEHRAAVLAALPGVREALGQERALLLTLRTSAEGGDREIADEDLAALLIGAIRASAPDGAPLVDLVDVETARDAGAVRAVAEAARARAVAVVGSFHDFAGTPEEARIVEILRGQRALGADLPKVAVTPRDPRDVLALLGASLTVAADEAGPHLAISMGSLGAVSRVAAETFGSAATFASAGEASAPGQLDAEDVSRLLDLLRP